MLLDTTGRDSQSEKEVRKIFRSIETTTFEDEAPTVSRFTVDYWRTKLFRPKHRWKRKSKEVQQWYIQVQHGGRREKVGLGTNNAEEAARRAARFYKNLVSKGWDVAWAALSPDKKTKLLNPLTVGDLIDRVRPLSSVRARTFEGYAYALRKIARETTGKKDINKRRFDPKSRPWRKAADLILLAKLTPVKITDWKLKKVAEAGADPMAVGRARRNINSFIRNARALFSRKMLKMLRERGVTLPSPLPFEEVELEPQGNTKYRSIFKAKVLLIEARKELGEKDTNCWIVILLGLGAGLRRKEIDALRWDQIDFDKMKIFVVSHEEFEAKNSGSEDEVSIDAFLASELKRIKGQATSGYVVEPGSPGRPPGASQYYRANETFVKVTKWLRDHGVKCDKPLHTLRKEFGSIICELADVYAASTGLRHKQLSTTTNYYTENRRPTSVPVGAYLSATNPYSQHGTANDWVI